MERNEPQNGTDALFEFLRDEPTLVVRPDDDYGRIFEVTFTPCCVPLPVLFWFNAVSRGVFVRIIFPAAERPHDPIQLLAALNALNFDMPAGAFTANLESGEVRFKTAVFLGDLEVTTQILGNLAASSFEIVRVCHDAVVRAVTGQHHTH
jgi:hypothetical protein